MARANSARALIMSGYGINSEMETQEALLRAGMAAPATPTRTASETTSGAT
ncbi:MAG: Phosphoribosylformylglycinamidine synthase subunit I [Methanoculleus marisnigri]|uniref:Phosphoribosylformylglycinamidine synthase subunit I n=1 Tax=Methanoculleus marisnigri TaxID=2198 RepID=A0A101IYQ3_9EURY|nr:MAG: Phosphoribosylformylglycinamidine synthase subunit I [Methanoculleus marisnigri]